MSSLTVREIRGKGEPVSFPDGVLLGTSASFGNVNHIGDVGQQGFGVGICPTLPAGFSLMDGTKDIGSENYGNYQYSDGSVMVWVPAFYYKIGTGVNGLSLNIVDVKSINDYSDVSVANAAGYALHRAFYNAGAIQPGFFVDKYLCSNKSGIASAVKMGNPLSSGAAHNPFAGLTGAPSNNYGGAIAAAKTRGASFFCQTIFINKALALLSLCHGQNAASSSVCAWYDGLGVRNFPKGCNNNALGDFNDSSLAFVSDGYLSSCKTGSANFFAKTTHNGQANGVSDLNGCMWEVVPGVTSDSTNYYIAKLTFDARAMTGGTTLATDAFGAAGIAAQYDLLGATYESLVASSTIKNFGASGAQVFSGAVSGLAWAAAGAGIPLAAGVGGSNAFGVDHLWDFRPNNLCPISGGYWTYTSGAGVWCLGIGHGATFSANDVGFRAAYYL